MEPLPHGLWSCSSKPLTGRTGLQTERGTLQSTGTTGVHPGCRNTPTTTGQGLIAQRRDDMPCRTTPLRLLRLLQPERRDHLANRHLAGDRRLRIAHPLTPTSVQAKPPLLLRTGHSMAKLTPIDTECHHGPHTLAENTSHVKCFSSTDHIFMTPTAIHVKPSTGRPMRSPGNHVVASNHGSISCTSNSVCIHCFCNIPNY